ncbi:MAG: NAD-dependent epimerase/dehydratase family protein [Spirochaetes bacterium]|nr:NAD-dependent epimerase/dehydratase family protein [Spirochaetota bacterium]
MKVLFIGGTGNISSAVSRFALSQGIDLYHLNRGTGKQEIAGAKSIHADIKNAAAAANVLEGHTWDAVVDWIGFLPADVERDIALFAGKTKQYIFISSASVYQKPVTHPIITESTPLANPFWEYSRNKIACEERLMKEYRDSGFPATIVRPSLTYDTVIPLAFGGWTDYTIIDRMKKGKPVIVPGDGTSIWQTTHADDFAKGFVPLIGHQQTMGHAFHITTDELLTWNQYYQATAAAAGVTANIVHIPSEDISRIAEKLGMGGIRGTLWGDKSWSVIFDNSKIKRFAPGYCATIPFAQGIRRTLAYFEADPARCRVNDEANDTAAKILNEWNKH